MYYYSSSESIIPKSDHERVSQNSGQSTAVANHIHLPYLHMIGDLKQRMYVTAYLHHPLAEEHFSYNTSVRAIGENNRNFTVAYQGKSLMAIEVSTRSFVSHL